MCGIAGFISKKLDENDLSNLIGELVHRGPNDTGRWMNFNREVGLAHARLSIRDLSSAGHQPMVSTSGRYCLIYNGEIYNIDEIKNKLLRFSVRYVGHSDTEILLHCIENLGIEETISLIDGMYAFSVYDQQESVTYLVRDKFGIKPLYYGYDSINGLIFSSELTRTFRKLNNSTISRRAVESFKYYNYIPSPLSIYESVKKLEAGHFLKIKYKNGNLEYSNHEYWTPSIYFSKSSAFTFQGSKDDAVNEFENLLNQSLSERVVSDVPYGAFLSGGIDSSIIVSGLAKVAGANLNTFSVGFEEKNQNEREYAKIVSSQFKTTHHELILTDKIAYKFVEQLHNTYLEPFADSSQIPMLAVSELASKHVKVVFSGDGADELFGGYHNYGTLQKFSKYFNRMPVSIFTSIDGLSGKLSPYFNNTNFEKRFRRVNAIAALMSSTFSKTYAKDPRKLFRQDYGPSKYDYSSLFDLPVHNQMITDTQYYMTDDVLCKVDRASMRYSIEARSPFLDDIRFFKFAWSLPDDIRFSDGQTKAILKLYLNKYFPSKFTNRPKQGFSIPLSKWIQGEFKTLIAKFLSKQVIDRYGYVNDKDIFYLMSNINDPYCAYKLWGLFVLHQWLENNI